MTRLSREFLESVRRAGIDVQRVDRDTANILNKARTSGDLLVYTGWYWNRIIRGRVVESDKKGPFPCPSAAMTDAVMTLQIRFGPKRR